MSKIIELTQGFNALIDDNDYDRVMAMGKWYAARYSKNLIYAIKSARKNDPPRPIRLIMHRAIMAATPGVQVDHINGNGLDNRKINLRLCSNKENIRNQRPQIGKTSKYKGVHWRKGKNKWYSRIVVNQNKINLGCYLSETEAARAYDKAALKYFGEFARPNFPEIKNDTL